MNAWQTPTLFAVAMLFLPAVASAVTCTVTGSVMIESEDTYFCDTSFTGGTQDCSWWKEVNLDTAAKPMRYIRVSLRDPAFSDATIGTTYTDANGNYSVAGNFASSGICGSTAAKIGIMFIRVHEADINAPIPRFRFRMRPFAQSGTYSTLDSLSLVGSTTNYNKLFARASDGNSLGLVRRLADLYYTTNSMLAEVVTWTSNLSAQFASTSTADGGIMQIRFENDDAPSCGATGCADRATWSIELDAQIHGDGGLLRHEVGHLAHFALHDRKYRDSTVAGSCLSSQLAGDTGRDANGCEWGSFAMLEGFPSFLGLRSITASDTNIWFCSTNAEAANLGGGTGQNSCSECRTNAQADADRMIDCGGTSNAFRGIGDDFATSASHCIRLKQGEGCDWTSSGCDDFSPADGWCDGNFYQTHGWRNHIQILRFYWDILDTSTDGGLDDTNLQMFGVNGFATAIEAMPCSAAGAGTDGNCNEFSSSPCNPLDANGLPVSPMTGSRDAYNPFDFAQFIPLNQDQERALNCVAGAGD